MLEITAVSEPCDATNLPAKPDSKQGQGKQHVQHWPKCQNCGNKKQTYMSQCPAKGKLCHKCSKYNHFAKLCKSVKSVDEVVKSEYVFVKKPNGNIQICLSPKALKDNIHRLHYPMCSIDDIKAKLAGGKYFSVLDLTKGYWLVCLDQESSFLKMFNQQFGRYH